MGVGPNLSTHNPIDMYETISGNTENTQNPPQASGQTFTLGSPIQLHSAGGTAPNFAQVWDGSTIAAGIYGISKEAGANLGVSGSGYPTNFGQQGPPWSSVNIGAPPNQPDAVTIPYGSPFVTGGVLTMLAVQDTLFVAQVDTSEGTTTISAGSVTSGVLSATATNVHYVGELVVLAGFTSDGAVLNGLTATVLTASGSAYTAQLPSTYTGGNVGSTGTGTDTPGPVSPGQWNVGNQYGLTVDGNGSWYIDVNKRTSGSNTVVSIYSMYPGDVLQTNPFVEVPNGQLVFQILASASQV